jgi:hypothetical protein
MTMVAAQATARALMVVALLLGLSAVPGLVRGQDRGSESTRKPSPLPPKATTTKPVKDYVIATSGLREGRLLGCAGESCTIEGGAVPIAQTIFIGLGVETPAPPQLKDYMHDQIVLRDGSVQQGRMVGISVSSVVTDRGSRKRDDVAWIYLVPKPTQAEQPAGFGAPQDKPARNEQPTRRETDRGGSSTPDPNLPPGQPAGARWFGSIQSRHTWNETGAKGETTAQVNLRLREQRQSLLHDPGVPYSPRDRPVLAFTVLGHDGSTIDERHRAIGGTAGGQAGVPCEGNGRAEVKGEAGAIWRNLSGGDVSRAAGFPVPREGSYQFRQVTNTEPDGYLYRCDNGYSGSSYGFSVLSFASNDPHTVESRITEGGNRITGRSAWSQDGHDYETTWSICREGVACPPPPQPGPVASAASDPDCPEPKYEADILNLALDQLKLKSNQLATKSDELLRLQNQARQYKSDFDLAIYTCNRIGDLQTLLGLLMGQGPENVQEFTNLLGVVQKVLDNDPTFLFSNEDYFDKRLHLEQIWDTLMYGASKVSPGQPSSAREQLMGCAGSNLDTVFEDAMKFVQLTEQIEPLLPQISKILNDMRAQDDKIKELWDKYHAACLRYAQCKKIPANFCEGLPASR